MRVVLLALVLSGCADMPMVDPPFFDVGWVYECTTHIDCDGQGMEIEDRRCGLGNSIKTTMAVWHECMEVTGPGMGCLQWTCGVDCWGVDYCTDY